MREQGQAVFKGHILTSTHCGQLQLHPTGSSANSLKHVLWQYPAPQDWQKVLGYLSPNSGCHWLGASGGTSQSPLVDVQAGRVGSGHSESLRSRGWQGKQTIYQGSEVT